MDLTEAEDIRRGGKKTQKLYRSLKMTLLKHFTQYASKFESSAVATGLEKVRFHCNPKERQCQRMFKFTSVTQSCPTLCDHMDCSTPCFPVHHHLPELAQTHVHRVSDAIQQFHSLSSLSPPAFSLSQLGKTAGKECSNYHITAFILHASKVILKILQARLQQYTN